MLSPLPRLTGPRCASGAITRITPMIVPRMATTGQNGTMAASLSAPDPGTTGVGVDAATAATDIAAATVIAVGMAVVVDMVVDTVAVVDMRAVADMPAVLPTEGM